jgi:hypothetical protein
MDARKMNNQKTENKTKCYLIAQSTNPIKSGDLIRSSINMRMRYHILLKNIISF